MALKTRGTKTDYASDVSDEEWAFCAPYLTLMKEDAPQREYTMRGLFNAVRYMNRAGCPWRMIPNDLPPWATVHQQAQRWIQAGCFEAMAHDLREVLRVVAGKTGAAFGGHPGWTHSAVHAREWPPRGLRWLQAQKGSKVHAAVDTLGHLLALKVTAANEQERAQVGDLVQEVQQVTGEHVEVAFVDQGYTGEEPAAQAARQGVRLVVVKLEQARKGFVLLPRRWVVERSFAWAARFRRLARDYERLPSSLAGLHWLAFLTLMLNSVFYQSA